MVDLTKDDESDAVKDPDYEKVVLYHHKPTGYYYNPVSYDVICNSVDHLVVVQYYNMHPNVSSAAVMCQLAILSATGILIEQSVMCRYVNC